MTTNQSSQSILLAGAGAGGVLGGHITQALTDAGHKVTGLGDRPTESAPTSWTATRCCARSTDTSSIR